MQAEPQTEAQWRELVALYQHKNAELQREYDDHTATSAMLEKELETTLDQKERLIKDIRQQNQRLEKELDFIKRKMDKNQQETEHLQNEVATLKNEKERHLQYIRELEQKNDDLERAQRVVSESVAGIEVLLNQAYERNAVLEGEIDEMEHLRVKLQRVTDEARDLKQELNVQVHVPNGNPPGTPGLKNGIENDSTRKLINGHTPIDSNRLTESETQTVGTPKKCDPALNGNTMTPSSRITALNIVGDLLRKVGGLESKLASCRAPIHTRESSHGSSEFNREHYRMRRISSRGPSSPAVTPNFIH